MDEKNIFDVLEGFKVIEILEQDQDVLKTKFKNDNGDERIVTQTKDKINIRWNI